MWTVQPVSAGGLMGSSCELVWIVCRWLEGAKQHNQVLLPFCCSAMKSQCCSKEYFLDLWVPQSAYKGLLPFPATRASRLQVRVLLSLGCCKQVGWQLEVSLTRRKIGLGELDAVICNPALWQRACGVYRGLRSYLLPLKPTLSTFKDDHLFSNWCITFIILASYWLGMVSKQLLLGLVCVFPLWVSVMPSETITGTYFVTSILNGAKHCPSWSWEFSSCTVNNGCAAEAKDVSWYLQCLIHSVPLAECLSG